MDKDAENPLVKKQYEDWVYPEPVNDLLLYKKAGRYQPEDPSHAFHIYWPKRAKTPIRILVAGCGTYQAAVIALNNPESTVTAIDISAASLGFTKMLKEKHTLHNLDIKELSLLQVERLANTFDLIISTGVLHHLADPVAGGKALAAVLADDGVMNLMLYGSNGRLGVYMLQAALKAAGLSQSSADVQRVREILPFLPARHPFRNILNQPNDLGIDAHLVDTLLHSQDHAYSVMGVADFCNDIGMKFHSWLDAGDYCAANFAPANFPIGKEISTLSPMDEAVFVDNFFSLNDQHHFNVCKKELAADSYRVDFSSEQWTAFTPLIRYGMQVEQTANWPSHTPPVLIRKNSRFSVDQTGSALLEMVNGERKIIDIIDKIYRESGLELDTVSAIARRFFESMYKRGHLLINC